MVQELHPHIVVDERERSGVKDALSSLNAVVEVRTLEIGDFLTSERTCVERKTRSDFESSILDGRLFSQLSQTIWHFRNLVKNHILLYRPSCHSAR